MELDEAVRIGIAYAGGVLDERLLILASGFRSGVGHSCCRCAE